MAGPHENLEHAEHAQHAAHEGGENNKKIALIISVLALFLAFSETFGKSAQTAALNFQIEASNLWNFFQAKNIRRTLTIVASESAKVSNASHAPRNGGASRAPTSCVAMPLEVLIWMLYSRIRSGDPQPASAARRASLIRRRAGRHGATDREP